MSGVAAFVSRSVRAGRTAASIEKAVAALRRQTGAGEHPTFVETASSAEVRERTAELVAHGTERIVVIGGDGLVHHVVQGVAGSATVVGIVPVGTGNDIAAALGLPRDPERAVSMALGPAHPIDLLRSAAGWAVSVATVGFAAAVNERAERLRHPHGRSRYSVATMLELPRLQPVELVIHLGGSAGPGLSEHRVAAALVAIGNTAMFGGGMRICPDAMPDDGLLDVTVIEAVGRFDLLRHFGRVFRGTDVKHPAVSTHRARSVTLATRSESEAFIRADGEAWGRLPLTIDVVPSALRVAYRG